MTAPQQSTFGPTTLLTPGEVARLFRVDPKTVTRWGKAGRLACIRTPGGHRRYRAADVVRLLNDSGVKSPGGDVPEIPQDVITGIE